MIFFHSKIKKLISAYLDGEANEKEKNLVEEHLKKCIFCRKYCENLRKLSSALDKYKEEELSPDLEQRIKFNFLGEKYKGVAKMKNKKLIFGISSGALAILLMFMFVGHIQHSTQGRMHDAAFELSGKKQYERAIGALSLGKLSASADGIGEQYSPALVSGKQSQNNSERFKSSGDTRWITTTDNSSVTWQSVEGRGGYYYDKPLSVEAIEGAAPEGPIVIVEPYLPATGKEDKLIRNAEATLEVENIQKVYDEIVKIGKGNNGYLASANFNESTSGKVSAQIILRVPKEKFEETIASVRKLGQVKRFSISSVDISQDYNALVSELNTIKTVYDKIAEKLKEKKTDIQQAVRLESQLTPIAKRMGDIRNRIAQYDNLISVSTITINLYEVSWKLMIQESIKETKQHFAAFVSGLLKNSIGLLFLLVMVCAALVAFVALKTKIVKVVKMIFTKKSQ
ncbi:MAG: DUF4349 domain-containing protein [Candidatus Omnitrophica bacterium]|nr:DUF4349 domain-containing protein [Candidatus Omnitrophota bacterium]